KLRIADQAPVPFAIAVVATGAWAAWSAAEPVAWVMLFVAPLALISVAIRPQDPERDSWNERAVAAILASMVAGVWALNIATHADYAVRYFPLACAAATAIVTMAIGRSVPGFRGGWVSQTADALGIGSAAVLLFSAALVIGREPSAVAL